MELPSGGPIWGTNLPPAINKHYMVNFSDSAHVYTEKELSVLFADSPFLKAMLQGGFQEARKQTATIECTFHTFDLMMKMFYSSNTPLESFSIADILNVLELSQYMINNVVTAKISDYISRKIKAGEVDFHIHLERLIDVFINQKLNDMGDPLVNSAISDYIRKVCHALINQETGHNEHIDRFLKLLSDLRRVKFYYRFEIWCLLLKERLLDLLYRSHFSFIGSPKQTMYLLENMVGRGISSEFLFWIIQGYRNNLRTFHTENIALNKEWFEQVESLKTRILSASKQHCCKPSTEYLISLSQNLEDLFTKFDQPPPQRKSRIIRPL